MPDGFPDPHMPLPIVEADADEAWQHNTTDGNPDPTTPWGAACLWWQGLADPVEYRHALEVLSYNPDAWGDYRQAADMIGNLSILSRVQDNPDRDDIKYVRFIDYSGDGAGQVFEEAPLHDVYVVTVVKQPGDDWWRVWGLSHNHFPTTDQVADPD